MKIEYYESQLGGCSSKEELKRVVDEAYENNELSEEDIQSIKDYAQDISLEFDQEDFEREEGLRHGGNYLTDDELGLTQM